MTEMIMSEDFPKIEIDSLDKTVVFKRVENMLREHNFDIIDSDDQRPWGFFLSVSESQAPQFIDTFYKGVSLQGIDVNLPLRPKILAIEPYRRLSLQKHDRRAEIWRGIGGNFHVLEGPDEHHLHQHLIHPGDVIALPQGVVHRGIGLANWGFVAEIWQHTDPKKPSNEDDIIRLQDDSGRQ
jgi:mannose-6-phosphate isomerase